MAKMTILKVAVLIVAMVPLYDLSKSTDSSWVAICIAFAIGMLFHDAYVKTFGGHHG